MTTPMPWLYAALAIIYSFGFLGFAAAGLFLNVEAHWWSGACAFIIALLNLALVASLSDRLVVAASKPTSRVAADA